MQYINEYIRGKFVAEAWYFQDSSQSYVTINLSSIAISTIYKSAISTQCVTWTYVYVFQGNAGVGLSMLIIFITLTVASIGAMSAIGICERCKIERGGVYFLLSHVLGGQMASAVGILYCFGQVSMC